MKKRLRQLHLWLGLMSGLVVCTVALTGCLYCFEEEIRNELHRELLTVDPLPSPTRPMAEVIEAVQKKFPQHKIKNIRVKKEAESSVEVVLNNKLSVFVDPYSATVMGSYNKEKDFFGTVLQIHRRLYMGDVGEYITGASVLIFTFMLISGVILWWPSKKQKTKQKFSFKLKAPWKRLNYDLHSVLGFYASWLIIFTALSGLVWSFKWAENSMYWLSGSKKEKKEKLHSEYTKTVQPCSIDSVFTLCNINSPQCTEYILGLPEDSVGIIRVIERYGKDGFFVKQHQLFFDQYTGGLIKLHTYEKTSRGDKLRVLNYDIHTGKIFGLIGQLLVFFACLIVASLPITGFLMWWGKRKTT